MHETDLDKKWAALWAERNSIFQKIVRLLARELGHGEFSQLNIEIRTQVAQLARQRIKDWDQATASTKVAAQAPLQQLLSAHQDISKAIREIRDMNVGLPWGDEEDEEDKQ